MHTKLQPNFSHRVTGIIWNTLASASGDLLILEVRDTTKKQVSFSAFRFPEGETLWLDKVLEEPWWVNASAIVSNKLVFTVYLDTNNPDKKGILVYDVSTLNLEWWNNDFSLSEVRHQRLIGFASKLGLKSMSLDLQTGKETDDEAPEEITENVLRRPVQYPEDHEYFKTVQSFLADRFNLSVISALEYLEWEKWIFISYYESDTTGLANYLLVLSVDGEELLREKLDGPVKGIGLDTFFLLGGFLIFVKNKAELVSYKLL